MKRDVVMKKGYKYSVPILLPTVTDETREVYLSQMKAAKVERIFLTCGGYSMMTEEERARDAELFKRHIPYFEKNGIETGIWVSSTIGHGGPLSHEEFIQDAKKKNYSLLRTLNGEYIADTFCPLDENFTDDIANGFKQLAATGAKTIMIDDDYRLSQHSAYPCCCCDKHLHKISEAYGETVTLDMLKEAFKGGENKLRDAWLKAQGDSLRHLSKKIRKAVDEVDENVCIALACAWSPYGMDGVDGVELARILAGKNSPLLRLHGAPYWKSWWGMGWSIIAITEVAKTFAALSQDNETELMWEGDSFPRPRYTTPASHLELFDAILRSSKAADGILKYIVDYTSHPAYETGYVARHTHNLPLNEKIAQLFSDSKLLGVRIPVFKDLFKYMDVSEDFNVPYLNQIPRGDGAVLAQNSIPTIYEGEGLCNAVFGENARHISLSELEKGGVLDIRAALILQERGVDVGIQAIHSFKMSSLSEETDKYGAHIHPFGNPIAAYRRFCGDLKAGAEVQSYDGENNPVAWRYENANGQKFFVLNVDQADIEYNCSINVNYIRQRQLIEAVEWVAGEKIPAKCEKNPHLYIQCGKSDGLAVGLFNCYDDCVIPAIITLDKEYKKAEFYGCKGKLQGDKVILEEPISAYSYCAFKVFE